MAITAVAALASAGSVAAGIVAIETIATIAAVVSVVGAVTDNKALKKIGMGMGLAAMGSSLMASSGSAATAAGDAALGASESAAAASEASGAIASQTGQGALAGASDLGNAAIGGVDATSALNAAPLAGMESAPAALAGGAENVASGLSSLAPETTNIISQSPTANSAFSAGENIGKIGENLGNVSTPFNTVANDLAIKSPSIESSNSFFGDAFDKTSSWLDKNKTMANTLMQVGGQALSGAARGEAEQKAYDLQTQAMKFNQQQILNQSAIPKLNNNFNYNYARNGQGIIFNANKG